ncbi:MAG: hypothetical protein AAF604_10760 [Acidobacteriota bacterium]
MRPKQLGTLLLAAVAIFTATAIISESQGSIYLGETISEVQRSEAFKEAGGVPMTAEMRSEANAWQNTVTALANERRAEFETALEPPSSGNESTRETEGAVEGFEGLREGPLGSGSGGGGCTYTAGWCPPSCTSCSGGFPPSY